MDSTDSPDEKKTRSPRRTPPPVQQAAPEPETQDAPPAEEKPPAPAPEWLRYTGQTPAVFMDLGGEIEPGQVVRPGDASLAEVLLKRSSPRDFEPAEAPAPDADRGTAN
ncbi:hypothetical protein ABT186_02150 [Streptomyces sp. NPDC001634]|uniref:hypothetical protein n=1 Tax=Streptomyces sp. NPDC001634 TaxID=3154390 RepID=UPI0033173D72